MSNDEAIAIIQAAKELTLSIVPTAKLSADNAEYNNKLAEQIGEAYKTIFQAVTDSVIARRSR